MNQDFKNTKLSIFHLVSLMGRGGRAATALRQIRLLSARGHRVTVGCLADSTVEAAAREMGLEVFSDFQFRRGFKVGAFWGDCRRVSTRCDLNKVDILHTHLSQESWAGCFGSRMAARRPVVIRSRGVVVPVKPHYFNRLMHNRWTDHVVAPSRTIFEHLCSLPGFNREKVSLIPDGVDIARFSPQVDGTAIRREFNIPESAPLVVMVARLERVKGHEIFFKAVAEMIRSGKVTGLRALCACDERTPGAYEKTIALARELGADAATLTFTGLRADAEKIIAAADVVALPSLGSEGSSRVALETAASGKPLVASSVGCLPEVVENGVTGLIVPPGDPSALAAALQKVLLDPASARTMGAAARKRAETLFDENIMVERLESLYQNEAAKRAAR